MTRKVTVRADDLHNIMSIAATVGWSREKNPVTADSWERLSNVLDPEREPDPEAQYARIELPGYESHVGWLTEETVAGAGVLVVRDETGAVLAKVSPHAFRQIVPEDPPVYAVAADEERAALPPPATCICGPDGTGEAPEERPDCPAHGYDAYPAAHHETEPAF